MRDKIIISSIIGLVGLIGLYYLTNRLGFKQRLTKKDVNKENDREAMIVKKCAYTDLTAVITPQTVVFPGDPIFFTQPVASINQGSSFNLCGMYMGNHMGTHIDFPVHVLKDGKVSSDYSLNDLIGDGLILEVPSSATAISKSFIEQSKILKNDFVFFKTSNSCLSKQQGQQEFYSKYVYIEPEAAEALLEKKVRVVGIDYISVDAYDAEELPVHKILLSNDILIVENLELYSGLKNLGHF